LPGSVEDCHRACEIDGMGVHPGLSRLFHRCDGRQVKNSVDTGHGVMHGFAVANVADDEFGTPA
jgi:hypothetical protein